MTRERFNQLLALQASLEQSHAEFMKIIKRAEKGRDDTHQRLSEIKARIDIATCSDVEFDEDWRHLS